MRGTVRLSFALALVASSACRKAAVDAVAPADAGVAEVVPDARPPAGVAMARARCRPAPGSVALDDGRGLDDLEIGDGIARAGGHAVGFVHRSAGARLAAVALLGPSAAATPRIIDLGPTPGDVPPPRLAQRGNDLVVAAYGVPAARARRDSTRDLILRTILPGGAVASAVSIPQTRDDSLAFDLACAGSNELVVWDESTPARGVIRAAALSADQRSGSTRDVSPAESDAELPRVVPSGSGFLVLWIARRPDPVASGADAGASEATGEERAFGWLEMLAVDERGAATGPLRRLTPTSGHVSAYDVEALPGDPAGALLVVARDDGETTDGSGGALFRIRVAGDVADSPVAFATDGLGRGAPALVGGQSLYLAWIGHGEQLRLLPLDASGAPVGASSAEEEMNEGRPLVVGPDGRMLVAMPSDGAAQLRTFACTR